MRLILRVLGYRAGKIVIISRRARLVWAGGVGDCSGEGSDFDH